jgi:hypothetical protein
MYIYIQIYICIQIYIYCVCVCVHLKAHGNGCGKNQSKQPPLGEWGLKLLVYEALSYSCMRPYATSVYAAISY